MPRILVTNDDGVHSEGIKTLADALRPLGDVVVVDIGHPPPDPAWPALVADADAAGWIRRLGARDHKGRRGRVVVVGGDAGMTGAVRMAGRAAFAALHDDEPGTFYLTDYLVRNFERLVVRGLGLDRHPELLPVYFGNYRRLVYLAQTDDADLTVCAESAAARLGLAFERRQTGLGELATSIGAFASPEPAAAPAARFQDLQFFLT